MFDRIIKSLGDIPEHILALCIIAMGAAVALAHASHAFEVGTALTNAGLFMYKGKATSAQ